MVQDYDEAHGIRMNFFGWPLADQQAITDQLRHIILEHMAADPLYEEYNNTLVYWTTHFYGLPDEKAISQDAALAIAKQALMPMLGVTQELADAASIRAVFYDVTDPDAPLWRFNLLPEALRDTLYARGEDCPEWRVCVNAYTGEVTRAKTRSWHLEDPDFASDQLEFNN